VGAGRVSTPPDRCTSINAGPGLEFGASGATSRGAVSKFVLLTIVATVSSFTYFSRRLAELAHESPEGDSNAGRYLLDP
jgi:hypothetical protein